MSLIEKVLAAVVVLGVLGLAGLGALVAIGFYAFTELLDAMGIG